MESNKKINLFLLKKSLSLTGIFFGFAAILIALCEITVSVITLSSPTEVATRCFYIPQKYSLPSPGNVARLMLSECFFGNDALYFDNSDENTGISQLPEAQTDVKSGDIYAFDRSAVPEGNLPLVPLDLSRQPVDNGIMFFNSTGYDISPDEYLNAAYPIKAPITDEPLVLIVHTHGTEAYAPENASFVPDTYSFRSPDITQNVVAVGTVMADTLNGLGIPTLHCETMHDLESYNRSYPLELETIREYISKYPSIRYIFDVHRDAINRENGDCVKPVCLVNGKKTAQVMLLAGTDERGGEHINWRENLTFAVKWQEKIISQYGNIMRPVDIRSASFNQLLRNGSLLIEIGSCANTLSEAQNAAVCLAASLAELISENEE